MDAYDTRPVVAQQVQSLGARFIEIDLGDTRPRDAYEKGLTPEHLEKQRQALAGVCAQSDVVIATALVFGKEAPRVITREMIAGMRPGSVIVDLAIEYGGNVEGAELDKEMTVDGVRVIGLGSLPGKVSAHASQMYSANLANFIDTFWNRDQKTIELDLENEIIKSCLVTHDGGIVNEDVKQKRP